MAHMQRFGASLALLLATLAGVVMAQSGAPGMTGPFEALNPAMGTSASRIAGDWHSGQSEVIAASRPPLARGATDLGQAPLGTRLERMLLLLEPSAGQRPALGAELPNQLAPESREYHPWLLPRPLRGLPPISPPRCA